MPAPTRPLTVCAVRPVDDRARALEILHALSEGAGPDLEPALLDPRSHALVRVAGLIASGACAVTCGWAAQRARQAGATDPELAAVLVAIGSTLGASRLVEAAPRVAAAIGYDLAAAFEDSPGPSPAFE